MNEIDILKSIADNLSERKSTAALNNYEVLCNNIKYVNGLLTFGVEELGKMQSALETALGNDILVSADFEDSSKSHFYFRTIIPRIMFNDINIIEKFIYYTQADERDGVTIETVDVLRKDFLDFNNLVTSSRQFIDSLTSDAYQLIVLDPKETNFQVLTSLNSFNKYATKSIKQALFNSDIENSLKEFETLGYNERVRGQTSHITKCTKKTFGEKVDFLFDNLGLISEIDLKEEIKNLFSFSSEFTHIGYVSTFFTGSKNSEVIFCDDISPYLPSTENFNELKYEILETATNFLIKVYFPSIKCLLKKVFKQDALSNFANRIDNTISRMTAGLKTRNKQYYFFIKEGLISSKETIDLTCMCGITNHWTHPHDLTNIYCKNCGSHFTLIEIQGDPGYIITSSGPVKVIGSSVPDFDDLPTEEKIEMLKKIKEMTLTTNKN